MSQCKGCGKPIVWGKTIDGANIPLDPRPPIYEIVSAGACLRRANPETFMVTHFATCPKANDFSGSKK